MNADLVRAISEKRLIEFVYKVGRTRVVEPHDTAWATRSSSLAFQITGDSRAARIGWKFFDTALMHQIRVLEQTFAGSRHHTQRHGEWDRLFARSRRSLGRSPGSPFVPNPFGRAWAIDCMQ
jgi:hypothetical protein